VAGRGALDAPADGGDVAPGLVRVAGWAAPAGGTVARVEVTVDGKPAGLARPAGLRPDVAEAVGDPDLLWSGFEHFVELPLPDREWEVAVTATAGGEELRLGARVRTGPSPPDAPAAPPLRSRRWLRPRRRRREMRVLVAAHSMEVAGAELSLLGVLAQLSTHGGSSFALTTSRDGPLRERFETLGIPVEVRGFFPTDAPEAYEEAIRGLADAVDCDVVLANTLVTFPVVDVATRLGIPAVWAIHEGWGPRLFWHTCYPPGALHPAVRRRAEEALRRAAATVFVCDATRRQYAPAIESGRARTIPYGIDADAIAARRDAEPRAAIRERLGIAPEDDVLLSIGPVRPAKCPALLVHAFRRVLPRHPRALLVLLGDADDPYAAAMRDWVDRSDVRDRVRFASVAFDPAPWYRAADWLVLASDVESLPRTVAEALAFGLPVAATDVGGVRDLVDDATTGYLCAARDPQGLDRMLDRALAAPSGERRAMAAAGAQAVRRRLAPEASAQAYGDLLRSLAGGRRYRSALPHATSA